MRLLFYSIATLIATNSITPAFAQEVLVPDPALNAVIREAAQKPIGPLTREDLLVLNELDVCCPFQATCRI